MSDESYPRSVTGALLAVKKAEERVLEAARAFADARHEDEQAESRQTSRARIELELAALALGVANEWVNVRRSVGDDHD